jgi:hypothetical protein
VHHRIERDRVRFDCLAHHLAVHLTGSGHVHHQVALYVGLAGEAMTRRQGPAAREAELGGTQ